MSAWPYFLSWALRGTVAGGAPSGAGGLMTVGVPTQVLPLPSHGPSPVTLWDTRAGRKRGSTKGGMNRVQRGVDRKKEPPQGTMARGSFPGHRHVPTRPRQGGCCCFTPKMARVLGDTELSRAVPFPKDTSFSVTTAARQRGPSLSGQAGWVGSTVSRVTPQWAADPPLCRSLVKGAGMGREQSRPSLCPSIWWWVSVEGQRGQ